MAGVRNLNTGNMVVQFTSAIDLKLADNTRIPVDVPAEMFFNIALPSELLSLLLVQSISKTDKLRAA